jgi:hypothetical protein
MTNSQDVYKQRDRNIFVCVRVNKKGPLKLFFVRIQWQHTMKMKAKITRSRYLIPTGYLFLNWSFRVSHPRRTCIVDVDNFSYKVCMFHLRTDFHVPSISDALVLAVKWNLRMSTALLFDILQKEYLTEGTLFSNTCYSNIIF